MNFNIVYKMSLIFKCAQGEAFAGKSSEISHGKNPDWFL